MKKSADPIIQEKESANSAYKQSEIETRLDDSYCTSEQMKQDNHQVIDGYRSNGEQITLITENYDDSIREVFD